PLGSRRARSLAAAGLARRAGEPVAELEMRAGGPAGELAAQLADGSRALGDDVVAVDRLEVQLAREEKIRIVELGVGIEREGERMAHRVFDEPRLEVRVLDDEQLVGPLQQLVHRR